MNLIRRPMLLLPKIQTLLQPLLALWSWIMTLGTSMLMLLANLASGMVAAHVLEPNGRGILAAAILWPSLLASLLVFGLNDAVLYFIAGRRLSSRRVWRSTLFMSLGLTAIGLLVGWLVLPALVYRGHTEIIEASKFGLLLIPPMLIGTIFIEFLRARGRLWLWNLARMQNAILYPILLAVFYWQGLATASWFVLAFALSQVPTALLALFGGIIGGGGTESEPQNVKNLAAMRATSRFGTLWRDSKAIGRYGWQNHLSSMLNVVAQRIDQMLVALWLAPSALGLWVVAISLSSVAGVVSNSLTLLIWPRMAAAQAKERILILGLALRATLFLTAAACLVIAVASPWVLGWFFGRGFVEAAPVVMVLCLSILPIAGRDLLALAFKAADRSLYLFQSESINLGVMLVVFALFVPLGGLMGAALAMLVVRTVSFVYLLILLQRKLSMPISALLFPQPLDPALSMPVDSVNRVMKKPPQGWLHRRMAEGRYLLTSSPPE